MADSVWALEEITRALCAARLADAERERLAAQAIGKPRPVRATVAAVLRCLASWLDDAPPAAGERRLARAL